MAFGTALLLGSPSSLTLRVMMFATLFAWGRSQALAGALGSTESTADDVPGIAFGGARNDVGIPSARAKV